VKNSFNEIIKSIFERAVELDKLSRELFFKNLNSEEKEYEEEVKSLLEAYDGNNDFLEIDPGRDIFSDDNVGPHPLIGKHIGAYLIEEEIGIGGMGIVFSGKRDDKAFEQKVAIKILKQGLTSEYLVKRFENERQTLANLQHPNIAKLFDGGKTEEGLPYLVMEYIDGVPITEYCEEGKLSVDERLELFISVCNAVEYAHQNLIIHRDIKPENILVTTEGRVKLLDFGVSKLLDEDLINANAGLTKTGTWHLTPEYASPEQINGENINTSSDIYSLGVLLYRLIAKQNPYKIYNSSPLAISKILSEGKIIKPSEVIQNTTRAAVIKKEFSQRGTEFHKDSYKKIKGDLDNIILKAMHKDTSQRYTSVKDFAIDISKYMNGHPVSAHEDTLVYRFNKFVKRHKAGVAVFILFNIVVLAGIAAIIYQGRIAAQERDKAKIENAKFEKVNDFLAGILTSVDPSELGRDVKVYDILDKAAENVETDLKNQPEIEASIRSTLGNTYVNLGEYDKGKPFLEKALSINEGKYGIESEQFAFSLHDLALYYDWVGDYKKADSLYKKSVNILRKVLEQPTFHFAEVLNNYGLIKMYFEKYVEAEKLFSEAIEIAKVTVGEENKNTATFLNNLALNLTDGEKLDEAEINFKRALKILVELLGENRPEVGTSYNNLGYLYSLKKDYKSAEIYLEKSYKLKLSLKGDDHSDVGLALNNLGVINFNMNNYVKAENYFNEAMKQNRKSLAEDHPYIALNQYWLGKIYLESGRLSIAENSLRKSLKTRIVKFPPEHKDIWRTKAELGICLLELKKYEEAETLLSSTLEYYKANFSADKEQIIKLYESSINLYKANGNLEYVKMLSLELEAFSKE
jgi:serine/threonine-protein kinase